MCQYQILKHPFTEVTGNESKYVDKDLLKRAIGNYQTARYIIGRYGPKRESLSYIRTSHSYCRLFLGWVL